MIKHPISNDTIFLSSQLNSCRFKPLICSNLIQFSIWKGKVDIESSHDSHLCISYWLCDAETKYIYKFVCFGYRLHYGMIGTNYNCLKNLYRMILHWANHHQSSAIMHDVWLICWCVGTTNIQQNEAMSWKLCDKAWTPNKADNLRDTLKFFSKYDMEYW